MKKSCLTCKYEPDWGEWKGVEYVRCYGECKFRVKLISLPPWATLTANNYIVRHKDDSSIHFNCKAWEAK